MSQSLSRVAGAVAFAIVALAVALGATRGLRDYFVFPQFHAMCYLLVASVLWQHGGAAVRGLAAVTWIGAVAVYLYLHLALAQPWIAGIAWIGAVAGAVAGLALATAEVAPRTRPVAWGVAAAAAVMAIGHVGLIAAGPESMPWLRPLRSWPADLLVAGSLALLPMALLTHRVPLAGAGAIALVGIAGLPVALGIGDVTDLYMLGVPAAALLVSAGPTPRLAALAWVAAAAGAALCMWNGTQRGFDVHVVTFHATAALLWPALLFALVPPRRMDPTLRVAAVAVPALYAITALLPVFLWPPDAEPQWILWCRYGSSSLLELASMAALPALLLARPAPERPPIEAAPPRTMMPGTHRSQGRDRQAIAAGADPQDPRPQRDP